MHFPKNFIDNLRDRVLISEIISKEINLIKKHNNFLGLCPFHNEKTPSFTVNDNKGFYHCFGCGEHGDVFDFLMKYNKVPFSDSVAEVAKMVGVMLPAISPEEVQKSKRLNIYYEILELVTNFYQRELQENPYSLKYLEQRRVSKEAIKKFRLGYSNNNINLIKKLKSLYDEEQILLTGVFRKKDNEIYSIFNKRVVFPIFNQMNKVEAMGGRALSDQQQPKYLNSPETEFFHKRTSLYGINFCRSFEEKSVVVTEGYMDVISLFCSGVRNTVGVLGTAITNEHMENLWRVKDEVVFCMDGDLAGKRSMNKAALTALENIAKGKVAKFVTLDAKQDPDDYIKENGVERFKALVENASSLSEYLWINYFSHIKENTPEAKVELESLAIELSKKVKDQNLSNAYLEFFRRKIWSYLNKNNRKSSKLNKVTLESIPKIDKITKYELILIYLIAEDLEVLESDEVKNYIVEHEFNSNLSKNLFDQISNLTQGLDTEKKLDIQAIKNQIPKEIIRDIAVILDKNKINNYISSTEKWFFVTKLITIETLKIEYSRLLRTMNDSSYKKASLIKAEITSLETSLKEEINK